MVVRVFVRGWEGKTKLVTAFFITRWGSSNPEPHRSHARGSSNARATPFSIVAMAGNDWLGRKRRDLNLLGCRQWLAMIG